MGANLVCGGTIDRQVDPHEDWRKDPNHLNLLEFFLNQIHLSILVRDKILIGQDRKLVTANGSKPTKGTFRDSNKRLSWQPVIKDKEDSVLA